uniref:Uncharacterized protein n=1 Tax=Anguilla anguilla TaxID=7936 RepID=A0A0E9WLN4_ANGAN
MIGDTHDFSTSIGTKQCTPVYRRLQISMMELNKRPPEGCRHLLLKNNNYTFTIKPF